MERWKEHPVYLGYWVSDRGRVRGIKGGIRSLYTYTKGHPRQTVSVHKDGKQYTKFVHHLVLETFCGPRPEGMECCHGIGGPLDNSLKNLTWGTKIKNQRDDRRRDGTVLEGEKNPVSKLTSLQVEEIVRQKSTGGTCSEIAKQFNVSKATVGAIIKKKIWKHKNLKIPESCHRKDMMSGERNGRAKLTFSQVKQIKKELSLGVKTRVLADKFSISIDRIQKIKNGKAWKTSG